MPFNSATNPPYSRMSAQMADTSSATIVVSNMPAAPEPMLASRSVAAVAPVAIVISNPIAADMAKTYGISKRKTASLLDTFSCVFQGILPYGAQMLVAISAATELGFAVSAFQIIPFLFYPFLLLISSLVFIFIVPDKKS